MHFKTSWRLGIDRGPLPLCQELRTLREMPPVGVHGNPDGPGLDELHRCPVGYVDGPIGEA